MTAAGKDKWKCKFCEYPCDTVGELIKHEDNCPDNPANKPDSKE